MALQSTNLFAFLQPENDFLVLISTSEKDHRRSEDFVAGQFHASKDFCLNSEMLPICY